MFHDSFIVFLHTLWANCIFFCVCSQHLDEPLLRDRQWVVIYPTGASHNIVHATAKVFPHLVLVKPNVKHNTLILNATDMPELIVPIDNKPPKPEKVVTFRIQGEPVEGVDCGDEAAYWFETFLSKPRCRLMYSAPTSLKRPLNTRELPGLRPGFRHVGSTPEDKVAFTDICPFLVLSQASVDFLNRRLCRPVELRRFRPNIFTTDCPPHAEDSWEVMQVGETQLRGTWQCPRCIVTVIDPDTGIKDRDNQPLATLKTYRMVDNEFINSPVFGRYFFTQHEGVIRVGDFITAGPVPLWHPSKHRTFVEHLYNVGPTSKTLGRPTQDFATRSLCRRLV